MSNRMLIPLTLAFALAVSLGSAQAGPLGPGASGVDYFAQTVMEDGRGSIQNPTGRKADANNGFMQIDPNTGMKALTYTLPNPVGSGLVGITAYNSSALSDAIDFYTIGNTSYEAYYSLAGGGTKADTGLPNGISFIGGSEDAKGYWAFYSGGSQGLNNDYYGRSTDLASTPEPASLTLAGLNILGVLAVRYRLRCRSAE